MARPSEFDVANVMLGALPSEGLVAPILVVNDATSLLMRNFKSDALAVTAWHRRVSGTVQAVPWPPPGPFTSAIVRLPKARAELEMTLHAVASVVVPGGTIWLYGANDEGIKSAQNTMATLLGDVLTVETRRHCRVLSAVRRDGIAGLKPRLEDWRRSVEIAFDGAARSFTTYPGLFALGRIDVGTKLLLAHLPKLATGASVLDFGCGMGVIAAAARARDAGLRLSMLDNDTLALVAAKENVPDATYRTALSEVPSASLDAILSNPPIHEGKTEDHSALQAMIAAAPKLLRRGGVLQIVVQRRVGASELVRAAFGDCATIVEDGVFQVLRGVKG